MGSTQIVAQWCVGNDDGIEYLINIHTNEVLAKRVNGVIQEIL